jgi:hypothetical protein
MTAEDIVDDEVEFFGGEAVVLGEVQISNHRRAQPGFFWSYGVKCYFYNKSSRSS